ncbi:MAG TPA: cyclic nucleotide-binding domain-containing protein [Terriglobales bacterium]|nr:cyclic nucleotide-binding domain-containing protein [Terriglobales bacterium]
MPSSGSASVFGGDGGSSAASLLEFIRQAGVSLSVPAGAVLFQENEPCRGAYYVDSGELELAIFSGDRKLLLGVAHAGQLMGLPSVLANSPHQHTATAISDCRILLVDSETMRNHLQAHAESCLFTIQQLGAELLDLSANTILPLRLQPRYPKH